MEKGQATTKYQIKTQITKETNLNDNMVNPHKVFPIKNLPLKVWGRFLCNVYFDQQILEDRDILHYDIFLYEGKIDYLDPTE